MQYRISIKKKVARGLKRLPKDVQKLLFLLIEDLKSDGQSNKIGKTFLHWARINIIAILPIGMWHVGLAIEGK